MKKALALLLCICLLAACLAGCAVKAEQTPTQEQTENTEASPTAEQNNDSTKNTIYFLTPTATHGWMGQLGAFAAKKVEQINAEGKYKAYHYTADAGSIQNDQIDEIIANGDAVGCIVCAFDDDAASGEIALSENNIPWISVSRIIDSTMAYALVNISGNNASCGALCAAWLTQRGFEPGCTLVQFTGSTNTDATIRSNGFYDFLTVAQTVTDAELLAETRRSAWDATYRGIYPDAWIDEYDLAEQTQRERARLEQTDYMAYLVMDGGQCAGYFSYGAASHGGYKDFSFCLNSLYLLPPYQHMGLGRRIFAQVRQAARERKLDSFFCGCNVHNLPARRFYEKMGGVVGEIDDGHENLAEDQMYFEFCTGEQI